jgi:phospho-N-acetylmuramoyl-pentapeptide-transferase
MGGILFLIILPAVLILFKNVDKQSLIALFALLGFGLIGVLDDGLKIRYKRSEGLSPSQKIMAQALVALIFSALVYGWAGVRGITLPISGRFVLLGLWYIPVMIFVMTGTVNAVNLTDGLDGLAAGVTLIIALSYLALLRAWHLDGLAGFAGALAGACLGFLFFNLHPAKIFMGDTGSLALGGAVGALAILSDTLLLLPLLGIIYVVEAVSVILQVAYFKRTRGRRLFRMAPLHHHYELRGWSEGKTVIVFWLVTALAAVLFLWIEWGLR